MSSLPAPPGAPGTGARLPFPPSVPPESAYAKPDVDTSLRIGDLLEGRYQVEAPLGEGGVGVVYRALQLKLHRRVAVKLLQHEVIGEEELRPRFQQEALTLAALSHPHIVTLQDYGLVRGRPFLVMELLEGRTLRQIIDTEAPIAPLRTLTLLRQVLLALAYAHEFGVVHRDLKPANLIVQTFPAYEHVKVLDFGMVKLMPGSHLHRGEQLTRQGFTFGTPAYMSPEHAIGAEVDMRSDLYSVGILLFELLTGQKPFDGEVQDVLRHHLNTPVPLLTERRPELAELSELQALVDKAMAKEPDDRFPGARAMLAAFDELLTSGLLHEPDHVPAGEGHPDAVTVAQLAPKLRETLETAANALSSYARSSREVWRDKASPQLLRAQRELRAVAARLAPKLRMLSESAWDKLRPQLVRAAERVAHLALEAKSRVETRLHSGHAESHHSKVPLALPADTQLENERESGERVATESFASSSTTQQVDISELERVSRISLSPATQQVDIGELEEVLDAHFAAKAATVIDQPKFDPSAASRSAPALAREAAGNVSDNAAAQTAEPLTLEPRLPVERSEDATKTAEPLHLEPRSSSSSPPSSPSSKGRKGKSRPPSKK
jgi:serine/threonine protein kinase